MNEFLLRLTLIVCSVALCATASAETPAASPNAAPPMEFDSFLVVLLVRPPNAPDVPKDQLDQLQEGHMASIRRLAAEGKLLKAGPFEDYSGRNVRGMFILKTESEKEARQWISEDPLIKAGRLVPEFLKWYIEKGSLK